MSIEQYDDELATQYALARRDRPDLEARELADIIVSRLTREQLLHHAEEARAWAPESGGRRELAGQYIQNFILAMETDPNEVHE